MRRKEFLVRSLGSLSALALLGTSLSRCKEDHSHHSSSSHHSGPEGSPLPAGKVGRPGKFNQAILTAQTCIQASRDCLTHCLAEMAKGDQSLEDCAKATRETIAVCNSFLEFASQESRFLRDLTRVCIRVCQHCADECEKHSKHHEICRICRDACLDCILEMKRIA